MAPWQVLRANRVARAGWGYRVHHGPGVLVHYSTVPDVAAAAVAPDNSRSFCMSREKLNLQQLNRRLATYMQQVQCLEVANQRLERQIQQELDRKCPTELRQLDRHLKTAELLHDQISECLSAQAKLKLQLLSAELTVYDFNIRCEKECERRGCVEAELSDLRLLEEVLKVHTLPELQTLLNAQTQQLMELQIQHQQDMQGFLAQESDGVAVEVQAAGSSYLIQQLEDLRQTSVTLFDKNHNDNTQVHMLSSPEMTFDPPARSEVVQAELEELRRTATCLEEELTHLQALNMVLEASGLEQTEFFVQQLVVLQQRADGLCRDLDSLLQAAAQQAANHQTLLDVKSRLETEIQDYRRLLDGLNRQGVSSLHSNSVANITSFCATTNSSAFRKNITANKRVSVQGGNLRMMGVQSVRQTPVVAPLSETKTTVQSIRVHSKHPKSSPVKSINTSSLTGSFHKSENQRAGALSKRTKRESMTISAMINKQSSLVENKVQTKDCGLQSSTQTSESLDKGAVVKASKLDINTTQGITTLVPDTQSARSAAGQAKTQHLTSKQTTTEAGLQASKTGTNIQTEISKTILCRDPEVKQGTQHETHTATTDSGKNTAVEIKKETATVISTQMSCTEGSIKAKNQDPAQAVPLSLETPAEAIGNAGEVAVTASIVSGSHILRSEVAQGKVSGEEAIVKAIKLDINTAQGITTLVPDTQPAKSAAVQAKPETFTSKQSTAEAGLQDTKMGTNIQTEITKTILCAEPEVKQESNFVTHMATTDPSKETVAEVKKETKTVISAQMECTESSTQAKNQDPAQAVSLSLETPAEAIGNAGEVAVTASIVSGSHILRSEEAQGKVSGEEAIVKAIKLDINTAQGITTLVPDTQPAKSAAVQAKPETFTSKQSTAEAGLQDTKTGTNIQTEITKTILCAEPEVKQESNFVTHMATTDPSKETVAEVKKETKTVISAQMECTESSTQAKNQDPAQAVSLSLETPAEAIGNAGEVAVTASIVSGSHILRSEEAQGKVSGEEAVVKAIKLDNNTAQRITTLVPDTQPVKSAAVQAKPETFTSKQSTAEAGLQDTKMGTNIQTEITKTILCAEPEVKQESDFVTHMATTDPSKETVAEVKKETKTIISAQMECTESSTQAKSQDPAQAVSLSLETPAEAIGNAGEVAGTASIVSGSHILRSEEAQGKVSGEEAIVKAIKLDNNTAQRITTLVPDTQPVKSAAVQAKPETFTSKQSTAEAGLQDTKMGTNIQTEITKTILCAEPEVKQESDFVTHMATTDPSKETVAEVKKETKTIISAQMECTESSTQAKSQDPAQAVSLSLETPAEAIGNAGEVAGTASIVSGSHILRSEEAQGKVSGEEAVVKAIKLDINTAQGITTLVPDTQPVKSAAVQAKPETFTSKQSTAEAGLQDTKMGTNIQTEITKTIFCAEPEVKQESDFVTHMATTDPSKETVAEVKKETKTVISAQMDCTESSIQAKNQDPAQVVSLCLKTPAEVVTDAEEVAVTASVVSVSHILRSEDAQDKVSSELTLNSDKDIEREENKAEEEVECTLSNASNSEQNKVMKDADAGSSIATASSSNPGSNDNLESKTASTEILKKVEIEINKDKAIDGFHDTKEVKVDPSELDNLAGQEAMLNTTKSKRSVSLTDSGVALSSSDHKEIPSPSEAQVYLRPTKPFVCLSSETCLSPVETEVLMSVTDQVFCPVGPEEHVRSPDYLLSPTDPEMFLSPNDSDTCVSPVEAKGCLSPNGDDEDEEVCLSLTEANAHVRPVEKYILSTKEEGQSLSFNRDQALLEDDRNKKVSISVRDGDSLSFGSFEDNRGSRGTLNCINTNSIPASQGISLQLSSSLGDLKFGGSGGRSIIADKEEQLGFGGLYRKSVRDVRGPRDSYKDTSGIADNKDVQNPGGSLGGRYGSLDQKQTSSMDSIVSRQKNSDWLVVNEPGNSERVFVKSPNFGSVPANGGTTFSGVASNSGGSGMASDLAASFGGTATNSSGTTGSKTGAAATPGLQGRFRRGSGDWMVYGGSLGRTSTTLPSTGSEESQSRAMLPATNQPETGRFGSRESVDWMVYGGSLGRKSSLDEGTSLPSKGKEEGPLVPTNRATSPLETGRFSSRGGEDWMVYGGSLGRKSSLPRVGSEESPSVVMLPATSPADTRRFGSGGSGEWMVYSGSRKRSSSLAGSDSLPNTESRDSQSMAMHLPTSPPGTGRFSIRGSGEWRVYGHSTGRISSVTGSNSLPNAGSEESPSVAMQRAMSPPRALRAPRFGSGDSGEWRVYGGSTGRLSSASNADKISVSGNYGQVISPPSSYTSGGPRFSSAGSGGRLSSSSVVGRSSSVGSGGRLTSSNSNSKLSSSSGSHRTSSSGRIGSTGSGEWKPVYSSASGRRSAVGSAGRSGGGGINSSQRVPSPGGRISVGSSGWVSSATAGGSHISSPGSGSKLSSADSSDRISSRTGGRISNSSGSGRTNSTGGRVISSSDRPMRSTGSGAGGNKERISVCKMAALSMSAAGKERSQDQQRQAQRSQQQQQAAATAPLIQRWLTTGVGVTSAEPDGLDDIMRL